MKVGMWMQWKKEIQLLQIIILLLDRNSGRYANQTENRQRITTTASHEQFRDGFRAKDDLPRAPGDETEFSEQYCRLTKRKDLVV